MYYVFTNSEERDIYRVELPILVGTKKTLEKHIFEWYIDEVEPERLPIFVESFAALKNDDKDWNRKILIIKGDAIKATPVEIVTRWEYE